MASLEADNAGSSNVLQVDGSNDTPDTETSRTNESFHSTETRVTALSSPPTNISVSSESNLHIPGKLLSDIGDLKRCYSNLINIIHPSTSSSPEDNTVPLLNKEQISSGFKKVGVKDCRVYLTDLLDCVRPICLPAYKHSPNFRLPPSTATQSSEITSLTTRVEALCTQNREEFESLQTQMESLKSSLLNFESAATNTNFSVSPDPIPIPPDHVLRIDHGISPVSTYNEDFITSSECTELFDYLKTLSSLKKERGRSTIKFGEKYTYKGSREESIVEFPPLIKKVLDKLNENLAQSDVE